jgi:hypothetical protein
MTAERAEARAAAPKELRPRPGSTSEGLGDSGTAFCGRTARPVALELEWPSQVCF